MIHLGYETGTGTAVSIPLAHMAVTGQTQQSGKTTTLEALIGRGNLRAVVFVTKPGEKSFSEGLRILPYFKERADWEYVKELLETRRDESLSKWDGYLMRVCRRAHSLQDVRANVEKELPTKKSARPSHYEVLAGYLDLIIPELERVDYTDKLELQRGVNIMDLTAMSDEMQTMVIRSTIEHIHKRERNTVLVMPEAWKFIPEGGRSAVFDALQSLIREGATNGNFVWIDAQDLAVVSKRILKSVSVWILGKQQEANEVARTINHLIEPLRIRPDMIKSLGIGQFLICADSHPARKVYVQPRWLRELDAIAIARGEESVETAQAIYQQKRRAAAAAVAAGHRDVIRPDEMAAVTQPLADNFMKGVFGEPEAKRKGVKENAQTEKQGINPDSEIRGPRSDPQNGGPEQLPAGERVHGRGDADSPAENTSNSRGIDHSIPVQRGRSPEVSETDSASRGDGEDETMWKEQAEAQAAELKQLHAQVFDLQKLVIKLGGNPSAPPNGNTAYTSPKDREFAVPGLGYLDEAQKDDIYAYVKSRAQDDPGILQLLAAKPELRVTIEPRTIEITDGTLRGWLAVLISKGFFTEPRNGNVAFLELQRQGKKLAKPNVYRELDNLAEMGFVTKEDSGYQATGLKITVTK